MNYKEYMLHYILYYIFTIDKFGEGLRNDRGESEATDCGAA